MLRGSASMAEQQAKEVMIRCIHDAVRICVYPPASTEITRITRSEFGLSVFKQLERTFERQGIRDGVRIIVQALTGYVDYTCRSTCRRSRDGHQKRDEDHNEKHT